MHRMSEVVALRSGVQLSDTETDDFTTTPSAAQRSELPPGVEVYQVSGPLFFAVSGRLDEAFSQFLEPPRVFILRMGLVPFVDASGVTALRQLLKRCERADTRLIISGLREQPRATLAQMGLRPDERHLQFAGDFRAALQLSLLASRPDPNQGRQLS
jgi:SulP family sulfate permease